MRPNRNRTWISLLFVIGIATILASIAALASWWLQPDATWTPLQSFLWFVGVWIVSLGVLDQLTGAMEVGERILYGDEESSTPEIKVASGAVATDGGTAVGAGGVHVTGHVGRDVIVTEQLTQVITTPEDTHIPWQLQPRPQNFTGRETDSAWVTERLWAGQMFSVTASGGMGKTALVAEAVGQLALAGELRERFPDGVIFYSFYGQPAVESAMIHILESFAAPVGRNLRGAVRQVLGGRQTLLLLDGTEEADNLADLLALCSSRTGVSITTRDRRPATADVLPLGRLEAAHALELLHKWAGELAADPAAAQRIVALVGGLPLAVRLVGLYLQETQQTAVAYLRWLEPSPMAALDQGQRRAESVPLLLGRSVARLSPAAQSIVPLIGLLALQPFDQHLVAAGLRLDVASLHRPLGELVRFGLLDRTAGDNWRVAHPLVHTFARIQQHPTRVSTLGALADFLSKTIHRERERGLEGYAAIDMLRVHVLTLLGHLMAAAEWRRVDRLVQAVDSYLDIRGHATERVLTLQHARQACQEIGDRRGEGAHVGNLGSAYRNLGEVERAIEHYEEALKISREIGDRFREGVGLGNLGSAYRNLGEVERAIEHYEEALKISREIGDRRGEGNRLGNLGNAYISLGEVERAIEKYEGALRISREIGDRRGEGNHLGNLGSAYISLGEVERAIEKCEEALKISQEIGDRRGKGNHLGNLGNAYISLGEVERAIEKYEEALKISREIGDRRGESAKLGNLGLVYRNLGEVERAIEKHEEALKISREIGDRRGEGADLGNLGLAYSDLGEVERAIELTEQALHIFEAIKSPNADQARQFLRQLKGDSAG